METGRMRSRAPGTWLIRRIAALVPWSRRDAWLAEWEGELAWAHERGGSWTGTRLRLRALAAARDALWLRHRHGRQAVFAQDLRHALRSLGKRPGFAASVVLTLGLAIGAATAVFSVVDAMMLRPLPYDDPATLVDVWRKLPNDIAVPAVQRDVLEYWQAAGLFESLESYTQGDVIVSGNGEASEERAVYLSAGVLPMLGVAPVRGRLFTKAEEVAGARVALVGETYWRTALGGDAGVLGRTVVLNDEPYQIVGVLPLTFRFPLGGRSFWVPVKAGEGYRPAIARLRAGISVEAAIERADALAAQLDGERPREGGWGIAILPMDARLRQSRSDRGPLLLSLAVLAVVLVGCANAANLLLVHGATRTRELTIRGALGATRGRLMRLLLVQCAVLSGAAVLLGVAVAYAGVNVFRAIAPSSYTIFGRGEFLLDFRVVGFACLLGVLTGLLFGVGPAFVSSRRRTPLTGVERAGTGSRGMRRTRALLAAGELAIAMTLLVTASLLIRSFGRQMDQDIGVDRTGLVVLDVALPDYRYPDATTRIAFLEGLRDRITTLPAVRSATLSEGVPPDVGFRVGVRLEAEGAPPPEGQPDLFPINGIDDAYFDVLGSTVLAGRGFDARDTPGSTQVAMVDADLAAFLWPGVTLPAVVGRLFRLSDDDPWLTVVGVVDDMSLMGVDDDMRRACAGGPCRMEAYRPISQQVRNWSHVIAIRTTDRAGLESAVRALVREADPSVPIRTFESMDQRMLYALGSPRFVMRIVTVFTLIALGLASLGVYAVLAYSVAQRRREFGVRAALGASTRTVMVDVIRHAAVYATAGIIAGGVAAIVTGRVLSAMLFEISAIDLPSLLMAAVALAFVALAASVVPALRATRVSPLDALRTE